MSDGECSQRESLMRPQNSHRKSSALGVTRLEDRTLPALRVWTGDVNANWGANVAGNTNWSGDVLPVNGDDLLFPVIAANRTNTNDMTGLVVNTFTVGGTVYVIGGN